MSLAQLIDPGLLFDRPLGLTSSERSGRLLGISSNYVIRQAKNIQACQREFNRS